MRGIGRISLAVFALQSACQVVLPGHPRSFDTAGRERLESVELELLPPDAWDSSWETAEPEPRPDRFVRLDFPGIADVGPTLVGWAVDLALKPVERALEREQRRYRQAFGATVDAADLFAGGKLRYRGLRLRRFTRPASGNESGRVLASELVLSLRPLPRARRVVTLYPVYLDVRTTRAKVLTRTWWAPWTWISSVENAVDVEVEIEAESIRLGDGGSPIRSTESLPPLPMWRIPLDAPRSPRTRWYNPLSWFYEREPRPVFRGRDAFRLAERPAMDPTRYLLATRSRDRPTPEAMWIRVRVTEEDPSKGASWAERVARRIAEVPERAVDLLEDLIGDR